jgi:hypothetical protein
MAREYQLKEADYVRRAMAAYIAIKLEIEDSKLELDRPLPIELKPAFRRVLERIEAGIPFAEISELAIVRAHRNSERQRVRDFARFKRIYNELSLQLAKAPTPPDPKQAQFLLSLLAEHPTANKASTTARQFAKDFAQFVFFTLSECLDAYFLAELEDAAWACPFWLERFHNSLRIRHLQAPSKANQYWMKKTSQLFDRPPKILFRDRTFLFTGEFKFGTRQECREAVVARGGRWEDGMNRNVYCLVVADSVVALPRRTSKIHEWVDFQRKGWPCLLVSEAQWTSALNSLAD